MNGYDIDGVLTAGIVPEKPYVVISGRTFGEYDALCKKLAQDAPVYIRGAGEFGDREAAGVFKAEMIRILGVTKFYEDDVFQYGIINMARVRFNLNVEVILVQK